MADVADGTLTNVHPPLILDAKDELLFFRGPAHLEAYVEAIDVANGEYGSCWDSQGRVLTLVVETRRERVLGLLPAVHDLVRVRVAEGEAPRLADLHMALLRHLSTVGLQGEMPTTNDTADILAFAIEREGWT